MSHNFPDSPTESIEFGIYSEEPGMRDFLPTYYPSRFTVTTEKELQRTAANCEGQRVSIKELKNSTLHVTGKVHASDLASLNDIAHTTDSVEVVTPVIVTGALDAYVKSVERGELLGYDAYPEAEEWMFEYTIDLVSTGEGEYHTHDSSSYNPSNPTNEPISLSTDDEDSTLSEGGLSLEE